MNRVLIAVTAALCLGAAAFAQNAKVTKQTKCPVTGEALGSMGGSVDVAYTGKSVAYKGKAVKVCCGGCKSAIDKNPDKFFKMVYGTPKSSAKPAAKKKG